MNFITGKHIPRRTFVRGMGATVGLPFLNAMAPAGRPWSTTAAALDKTRLICMEQVHGAGGCHEWGATQNLWDPAAVGRDFDLTPTSMSPLEPFRDYLTIVSNTDARMAEAFEAQEIGGDHFRATATFLTHAHCRQTEGSNIYAGTSLDQLFANRFGQDTPLPSMQLTIEPVDQAGGCGYNYSCVYTDSLSWASPTQPLPMIRDPRAAFDQLFGAGGTPKERAARRGTRRSILDIVGQRMGELMRDLDAEDRTRMDQYLGNVRELERRIELTEARNTSGDERDLPDAPAGVPDSFREHVQLMFDLQVLAFEQDITRVFSFKLGRDGSARVYPESEVTEGFHPLSHFGDNKEKILEFAKLNRYHVSMVPYLLEKLKNTREGESSLLDKTAILYGSAMANPNLHNHRRCPLFLAGHANGQLMGNLHLKAPDGTPMANAMLDLLRRIGFDDLESFGDSTGSFSLNGPQAATAEMSG
jgi:hypothetical protein